MFIYIYKSRNLKVCCFVDFFLFLDLFLFTLKSMDSNSIDSSVSLINFEITLEYTHISRLLF